MLEVSQQSVWVTSLHPDKNTRKIITSGDNGEMKEDDSSSLRVLMDVCKEVCYLKLEVQHRSLLLTELDCLGALKLMYYH